MSSTEEWSSVSSLSLVMINGDFIIKTNDDDVLDIHQRLCLPKAELNTKNEPKRRPFRGPLGSFWVFNSIH